MNNKIIYCKKCHIKKREMSYENACSQIEKIDECEVIDKCMSSCGLGKKNYFAQIEDDIVMADTFEELLEEIREQI